jgi:hypothetical protein
MYILFYVCYTDTKCTKELQNKRDGGKEIDKNMYVQILLYIFCSITCRFLYPLIMGMVLVRKI